MKLSKIFSLSKGYIRGKYRRNYKLLLSNSALARKYLVRKNHGAKDSSYCNNIWIERLKYWRTVNQNTPKIVVEIGSGNSLGVGLAALISGSEKFYSLETVQFWNVSTNLRIFDELLELFKLRLNGDEKGNPNNSWLQLNDLDLQGSLSEDRINKIRKELKDPFNVDNNFVRAIIPWSASDIIEDNTVDYIVSQSALQHVDDLPYVYGTMARWLKTGGCLSHKVDFKSMNTTRQWNGHWVLNDFEWNIAIGGASLINREPYSKHVKLIEDNGLRILHEKFVKSENKLKKEHLASQFQHLNDVDLTTSGWFYFAIKESLHNKSTND